MGKNLMPEVAKMLGVEIGEEFKVDTGKSDLTYKLTENELLYQWEGEKLWEINDSVLRQLLSGKSIIKKLPWKPKCGERYWHVADDETYNPMWTDAMFDYSCLKLGNCFRTKEEAEANADRIRKEIMG